AGGGVWEVGSVEWGVGARSGGSVEWGVGARSGGSVEWGGGARSGGGGGRGGAPCRGPGRVAGELCNVVVMPAGHPACAAGAAPGAHRARRTETEPRAV